MSVPAFEEAFEKIGKLAATFRANEARYLDPGYQEAEARKDFIDKFFIALGWDVNHDQQTNPYEQEVKVEPPVLAGGQRRADYAFRVAPNYRDVRFFVEAKKPYADIATADNYFQTIRYAWNSHTPLAVLTDFEQFHVLDCRYKPDIDTALHRHVAKFHYSDYLDRQKFAEIFWLFSREAVANGSLEKRAKELPKPRGKAVQRGLFPGGYQSIDESFLNELDEYRTSLARTFKNNNPRLDSETLTELAQRTLDRLVFLRFLEDKGIEPQRLVDRFGDKGTAWEDFIAASRRLDGIYNGVVFKRHDILDGDKFHVDDTAFADICESLAHINSPYDFDAIPIHILGSIYERFLGNVIVATDKRVRVEPKPEVRKAGGVYYTPEYIVRCIVENTVGKLIAGKTPDQIAGMRFADIACGSGSFLLGVFDLLLTYHGQYYNDNPNKARKGDCIKHNSKLYLSLRKKREILLNNIYGVDLDAQAVEVCQLSLYLRLLQDETTASAHAHQLEFHETLLPPLNKNIVCGNSLIGRDILEGQLFASEEERTLNPMNFEDAFPEVMKRGGFDAVVGNPPYGATFSQEEKDYLKRHFKHQTYQLDSYLLFLERALDLATQGGFCGLIIPNPWLTNLKLEKIRRFVSSSVSVSQVIHFMEKVFPKATVDTEIVIIQKSYPVENDLTVEFVTQSTGERKCNSIPQSRWMNLHGKPFNIFLSQEQFSLMEKIGRKGETLLSSLCDTNVGIKPYQVGKGKPKQTRKDVVNRIFDAKRKKNKTYKPYVRGSDLQRYAILWEGRRWISYGPWLAEPRPAAEFAAPEKILIRQTGDSLVGTLDTNKFLSLNNTHVVVKKGDTKVSVRYILGIVNSKLMNFYYQGLNPEVGEALAEVKGENVGRLPIRPIDFSDPADKARHDEIVTKVDAMLEAKKQLAKAKTDKDKTYYENKCAALDCQIDRLVYDLYGLTEEEIRIVEEQK